MLFKSLAAVATMSLMAQVDAQEVHGQGAQGSSMGAVAFMWPSDRPWSAAADNVGPCGSSEGPSNRTQFPLGSAGAVSFSIADESANIELRIAYGNNPTSQDDFKQFHSTISTFEPGHQCRSVPASSNDIVAGTNATLQLEYWGNDSGKDESFFACADITFVEAVLFATRIPCFNVTADEFTPAGANPSTTAISPSSTAALDSASSSNNVAVQQASSNGGLSTAEKAGIAVATIVGAFLVASVAFFLIRRKRSPAKDAEVAPTMTKVASYHSGEAPSRN